MSNSLASRRKAKHNYSSLSSDAETSIQRWQFFTARDGQSFDSKKLLKQRCQQRFGIQASLIQQRNFHLSRVLNPEFARDKSSRIIIQRDSEWWISAGFIGVSKLSYFQISEVDHVVKMKSRFQGILILICYCNFWITTTSLVRQLKLERVKSQQISGATKKQIAKELHEKVTRWDHEMKGRLKLILARIQFFEQKLQREMSRSSLGDPRINAKKKRI